jgi:hypothetical protein
MSFDRKDQYIKWKWDGVVLLDVMISLPTGKQQSRSKEMYEVEKYGRKRYGPCLPKFHTDHINAEDVTNLLIVCAMEILLEPILFSFF